MEKKAFWWILFIVLVSVMTGIVLFPLYKKKNARMMELEIRKQELAKKEAEHQQYSDKVDALENSPESVEREAREKFNMARPGEKVLIYENNSKTK